MKFWEKLILFIITIISVVLSCSRYYIVRNNFFNSIENSSKQHTNQNILEKYMLESYIIKDIQLGEETTDEKMIEYLQTIYNSIKNNSERVAVYTEDYEQIYSNISNIETIDISSILNNDSDVYCLREFNDNHYMIFSSHWTINGKIIYVLNAYDVNSIYEERDRQLKEILYTDIIILAVSAVVIFIGSIILTKPINSLNKASKQIASGKFNERVNIKSKDEIGELANSFNQMAEEIENKINELNLQVKKKNDFINGFTHELKTPMTAMVGYSDLLRLKKCDEEVTQKALNYIYTETKRLENLSAKLMKLMSLTNDEINLENIDVIPFIEKIAKIENNIINNKIELVLEPSIIKCDEELLEVVIRNLIENANKSEPKDQKIIVKGENLENNKYKISVIDKGKGIPKEHIERVTEDFYMVDKARSRKNGGSGIGLSLVSKILKLHNSKLFIESEENVGTTVYFELEKGEI